MPTARLDVRGLRKQFPGVLALDGVSLTLAPGEVLAVVGENGAGKSTAMNILYGLYQPDAGEILLRGQRYTATRPLLYKDLEKPGGVGSQRVDTANPGIGFRVVIEPERSDLK